jgi:hypothetical protein
MRMFTVLEENLMVREARVAGERMQLLLETAEEVGMARALERFGAGLSDSDVAALKSLKPEELKAMAAVRKKLSKIDLVGVNGVGAF